MVGTFNVAMEIRPAPTRDVAASIGTVIPQQQDGVIVYLLLLVLDSKHLIGFLEVAVNKLFVALYRVVCEYDMVRLRLNFRISLQTWGDSQMYSSPDNGRRLGFYTKLSAAKHKCDRSDDCKAR